MSAARKWAPRAQVHRGTVEVVALGFEPSLLGESEARRRVLALWTPGAAVYVLGEGLLLRLPAPRVLACDSAPGLPFTLEAGVLSSAPLSASEREQLAPPPGSAVRVLAGVAEVHVLDASRRVDISGWLDVSAWEVVPVEGLGAPPPPVAVPPPVEVPSRAAFGVAEAAPEAVAMRARLEGREVLQPAPPREPGLLARLRAWWRGEPRRPGQMTVRGSAPAPLWSRLLSWLGRRGEGSGAPVAARPATPSLLGRWLSRFLSALGAAGGGASEAPTSTSAPPPPPSGPGWLSRLTKWLATSTPLGALLGRRNAEYVRRLFDLFDEGDLNEALRYAIPLRKGGMTEQDRVALGLPGPREQLAIRPYQGGASGVFGGGAEVYEALRERYRAAFRKLEREGRIEEAAFVLAELLHEDEAAVSFLERHGRLRLAAELAEGRKLAPGLVVRQWLLAKDVARAVDIARRTGAFGDAVVRLERSHPELGRVLRLLWGETLAEAGDYGRAVEAVWPVKDARHLARGWLERGVEVGGVSGARLLALLLLSFPDGLESTRTRVLALLDAEDAEGAPARCAFAETLGREVEHQGDKADGVRVLLRLAVRALLRDRAGGHLHLTPHELEELVRQTGDTVLRADLPSLSPQPARSEGAGASHVFEATEGGPWAIHDAVPVPGGRLLVALGEAGARLLSPDGRCVAHFDVPAFSLVRSFQGDRALAVAPRGSVQRLSRLDLARRRAEPWCDMRLDAFAPVYDGNLWFTAVGDTVMALDALALEEPRALWRVPQVGGPVLAVAVSPSALSFVTVNREAEYERWLYTLPDPTLGSRQALPGGKVEQVAPLSLNPGGELVVLTPQGPRWIEPPVQRYPASPPLDMGLTGLVLGGEWLAALEHTPVGFGVWVLDRTRRSVSARFLFEGPHPVSARFLARELVLFDTAGRLARMDLVQGAVRRVVVR